MHENMNMNTQTTTSFEQRIKQSTGNHKPNRHRKSHSKDPEILAAMKLKMAVRKAQNKHKRIIAKARLARDNYSQLNTINMGDATLVDLFDEEDMRAEDMREEALRQDMEDRDY